MMFAVVGTTISAAIVGGGLYGLGVVSEHCTHTMDTFIEYNNYVQTVFETKKLG